MHIIERINRRNQIWHDDRTGEVVGEHVIPMERGDLLTPAEIVAYSDKRVLHDKVVSLEERFGYLKKRYRGFPKAPMFFAKMRQKMKKIERLIEHQIKSPVGDLPL